jgi:hypothetical protein
MMMMMLPALTLLFRSAIVEPALGCLSFAPQLTDRAVCQPPDIALPIARQSRQVLSQAGAHFIAITVRKVRVGPHELP